MESNFKDWSAWIREGHFVSYIRDGVRYYEHVMYRDMAHWEYDWPETISTVTASGPYTPDDLEITKGYDENSNTNHIWQMIFALNKAIYVYIELPTDIHRHGIPKVPKDNSDMRRVSHFTEWMSPWHDPGFITEHIMMRPETSQIAISTYNPQAVSIPGFKLNIFLSKLVTERVGTERHTDEGALVLKEERPRFKEVLEKLYKRTVPARPLTIMGVRAPAEAPSGH